MHLKNLDTIDQQILSALFSNGRLSHAELGRKLGLTRAAVRERVNTLVNEGIISNFTIVVNPMRAGKNISTYFNIQVTPNKLLNIVEQLSQQEEITNIYQMSGKTHLHAHALFDNQEQLQRCLETINQMNGILSIETEFVIARHKERGALLI